METAKDRRELAREAGHGTTSLVSVVAGTLVAFGAVALVAAAAGAAGSQLGIDVDGISTDEWRNAGIAGTAVAAIVLFGSFFFGGYTAGRMSRRAGGRHGLVVFVLGVIVIAAISGAAALWGDNLGDNLREEGIPTDSDTWSDIGIGAAIAAVAAILLGSLTGAVRGDRWHGRLLTAADEHHRQHVVDRDIDDRDDDTPAPTVAHRANDDPTTVDVRDGQPSVEDQREDERERARAAHSDVGI